LTRGIGFPALNVDDRLTMPRLAWTIYVAISNKIDRSSKPELCR
jgi:hypothetical protein